MSVRRALAVNAHPQTTLLCNALIKTGLLPDYLADNGALDFCIMYLIVSSAKHHFFVQVHEQRQKDNDLATPAKRVLDLAHVATGVVRMAETANHRGCYVALIHCWGDSRRLPLMSTHATLEDNMSGIAISSFLRSHRRQWRCK